MVNSISTNVACTGSSPEPSENGVFAVIDVSVQTSPNMLESELIEYFNMDADAFTAIGPDGVTSNASPFSAATFFCLDDSELLPSSIGPGENARGKVLLDLEDPSGILIYEDFWTDSAWEWTYPG